MNILLCYSRVLVYSQTMRSIKCIVINSFKKKLCVRLEIKDQSYNKIMSVKADDVLN